MTKPNPFQGKTHRDQKGGGTDNKRLIVKWGATDTFFKGTYPVDPRCAQGDEYR